MKKLNVALVGYGRRAFGISQDTFSLFTDEINFVAVCDRVPEKAAEGAKYLGEMFHTEIPALTDYEDVIRMKPDAIVITSSWITHIPFSIRAMEAGIPVACEVGGAYTVDQCKELVATYERTKSPFMFLENCCFGRLEQLALEMKRLGMLGKIVHVSGGYMHDLRDSLIKSYHTTRYRLSEYVGRNCESYPSHEFIPLARLLDVNHGNRPVKLYSSATRAWGIPDLAQRNYGKDAEVSQLVYNQGDVVTTVIDFANGETMTLKLDTSLPRPYSRGFEVHGTRGAIFEDNQSVFIDGQDQEFDFEWKKQWGNVEKYYEKYDSPLWREFSRDPRGSHGGMDYLEFRAFFDCIRTGDPMPVDVYDAAVTMAITPLSEESLAMGIPVAFPDFTSGRWVRRMDEE